MIKGWVSLFWLKDHASVSILKIQHWPEYQWEHQQKCAHHSVYWWLTKYWMDQITEQSLTLQEFDKKKLELQLFFRTKTETVDQQWATDVVTPRFRLDIFLSSLICFMFFSCFPQIYFGQLFIFQFVIHLLQMQCRTLFKKKNEM